MSAGSTVPSVYETNAGTFYKCRVQPETLTLVINAVTNAGGSGTPAPQTPSAKMTGGRREIGINARLVRLRFTGTLPPGYKMDGILTLPILTPAVFGGLDTDQTGTYTLNGTGYDVIVVGLTAEKIR